MRMQKGAAESNFGKSNLQACCFKEEIMSILTFYCLNFHLFYQSWITFFFKLLSCYLGTTQYSVCYQDTLMI